jgi:hypothetical protein
MHTAEIAVQEHMFWLTGHQPADETRKIPHTRANVHDKSSRHLRKLQHAIKQDAHD